MKITKYIGMAFAIAALAACSNEEELTSAWQNDPTAMKVNATVGSGIFSRSNPLGDETQQKTFNNGDEISIAAGTQNAVVYKLTDGTWTPEAGYLKWETNSMDITAYYPVTDGTSAQAFTLPADQADNTKIVAADYMTYSGNQSKPTTGGELTIEMERKMARVIVKIEGFNNQYGTTVPTVENVKVKSGAASYADGAATGAVTDVTPYAQNLNAEAAKVGTTYTALVIPTTANATESFITMTVAGTALVVKGIPTMEAGKSYTYNLTIGKDVLTVGEVTVTPWGDEKIIEGGEATVIQNFKAAYTSADYLAWDAATLPKDCPTAQQMISYLEAGYYWDDAADVSDGQKTYSTEDKDGVDQGTFHTGLWLLKKEHINNFDNINATLPYKDEVSKKPILLSDLTTDKVKEIRTGGKYFFLPAAGAYNMGQWGKNCIYWSKTADGDKNSYWMYVTSSYAEVGLTMKTYILRPMIAE